MIILDCLLYQLIVCGFFAFQRPFSKKVVIMFRVTKDQDDELHSNNTQNKPTQIGETCSA